MIRIFIMMAAIGLGLGGCAAVPKVLSSRPMQFTCPGIEPYMAAYDHRRFSDLQKYAFPQNAVTGGLARAPASFAVQTDQTTDEDATAMAMASANGTEQRRYLLLSGGGQWGAFGAGFLQAQPAQQRKWNVITGISTGAIQTLFVGANQYDRLAHEYALPGDNPASSNGLLMVVRGSEHDLSRLRDLLKHELYLRGEDALLNGILANPDRPDMRIGMVEGDTTNLVIVQLSEYIRANLTPQAQNGTLTRQEVGDCITGLTLASSSIPLRLTPVQIKTSPNGKYRTYMDGGVRSSVIDQQAFDALETAQAMSLCKATGLEGNQCTSTAVAAYADKSAVADVVAPILHVIRNGPTIVPPGDLDEAINNDPDAYTTALRGYSILVNQNELASVAELQARYPTARLKFVSADGYSWMKEGSAQTRDRCDERDEKIYFDPKFMRCLIKFGQWRVSNIDASTGGWQEFAPLPISASGPGNSNALPPMLPSDRAFERAAAVLQRNADR